MWPALPVVVGSGAKQVIDKFCSVMNRVDLALDTCPSQGKASQDRRQKGVSHL